MIDWDNLRQCVQHTVKHHGTHTEGEAYRLDLVCDRLMEIFHDIHYAELAVKDLEGISRSTVIKVSVS